MPSNSLATIAAQTHAHPYSYENTYTLAHTLTYILIGYRSDVCSCFIWNKEYIDDRLRLRKIMYVILYNDDLYYFLEHLSSPKTAYKSNVHREFAP